MNTLESIFCYGGIVALLLGFILMAIVRKLKKGFGFACFAIIVLFCGGLICLLIGLSMYDTNTLDCEKEDIIITIQDKQVHTYHTYFASKWRKQHKHHYFFYFNDTEEIEVDASTYRNFNKGDTLIIKKTCYYRTDRETDERTLEKVTYNK